MRPIKFRGKRVDNGEWVFGDLSSKPFGGTAITGWVQVPEDEDRWRSEFFVVDPETVGQFTGLTDSEGVEIYEGDVLFDEKWKEKQTVEPIRWFNCDAFTEYGYHNLGSFQDDYENEQETSSLILRCKVIGNIHEPGAA